VWINRSRSWRRISRRLFLSVRWDGNNIGCSQAARSQLSCLQKSHSHRCKRTEFLNWSHPTWIRSA
jgi:hypothetical protein